MPFRNPLATGKELVKDLFTSAGYVAGSVGWALSRLGDAEFNNITARGKLLGNLRGSTNTDVFDYVNRLAYSDTFIGSDNTGYTTTPSAIPGTPVIATTQLLLGMPAVLQQFANRGLLMRFIWTFSVMAHSTSSTGSGGHIQGRYTRYDGSAFYDEIMQQRNGSNDGYFMMTQSWNDSIGLDDVIAMYNGTKPGPTFRIRHTGSTAYIADSITWTVTFKIL